MIFVSVTTDQPFCHIAHRLTTNIVTRLLCYLMEEVNLIVRTFSSRSNQRRRYIFRYIFETIGFHIKITYICYRDRYLSIALSITYVFNRDRYLSIVLSIIYVCYRDRYLSIALSITYVFNRDRSLSIVLSIIYVCYRDRYFLSIALSIIYVCTETGI